jgi:hypothetical protein
MAITKPHESAAALLVSVAGLCPVVGQPRLVDAHGFGLSLLACRLCSQVRRVSGVRRSMTVEVGYGYGCPVRAGRPGA